MPVSVEIVIPVLNEEDALPVAVGRLGEFIKAHPGRDWRIKVADNGSTDRTQEVARDLAAGRSDMSVTHLTQRGRGRALKQAWGESTADIRCYMDVDLSTDLKHLPQLVDAIADHGYDIAIGSRLSNGAEVVGRTVKREITSRGYSCLIRGMFFTPFRDAQCGFKAVSAQAAKTLVPLVVNNNWFFDTELLLIGLRNGWKIKEIPVHWEDDPTSRVKIIQTAWEDVKGLVRLRFGGVPRARKP
ncbi:MAG: glycosyltransferase family 2 protein [Dehalococcoidia bacterium]|nr:glycosyltransferase family 2 protein [Dehalococcoidia bacterium]MSQ34907.1 glycosyltransferase family 2 protein [Dehalococcoidia bacterium]